jgi:hypothetical protein
MHTRVGIRPRNSQKKQQFRKVRGRKVKPIKVTPINKTLDMVLRRAAEEVLFSKGHPTIPNQLQVSSQVL